MMWFLYLIGFLLMSPMWMIVWFSLEDFYAWYKKRTNVVSMKEIRKLDAGSLP